MPVFSFDYYFFLNFLTIFLIKKYLLNYENKREKNLATFVLHYREVRELIILLIRYFSLYCLLNCFSIISEKKGKYLIQNSKYIINDDIFCYNLKEIACLIFKHNLLRISKSKIHN